MMDISDSLAANSAQQNFDEYLTGPKTVTVEKVTKGTSEQPVEVHLVEFPGKPLKPALTVRRLLAKVWGTDSTVWPGRMLTIYGDPDVRYGGKSVGGLRVSHVSHIEKPLTVMLTETRGKRSPATIQPLAAPAPYKPSRDFIAEVQAAESTDAKRAVWSDAVADGADEAYLTEIKRAGS